MIRKGKPFGNVLSETEVRLGKRRLYARRVLGDTEHTVTHYHWGLWPHVWLRVFSDGLITVNLRLRKRGKRDA